MADLVFSTRGQAEALAAQESLRKKALEAKLEFEEAAKATGAWDAATMKLKSSAESALRSISSEQDRIVDKIAKIEAAQAKGLVAPKEAEEAVKRLRQQWIDVDGATKAAKEAVQSQETAHLRLRSTAETTLRGLQSEEEKILEQIHEIEEAMEKGLVPPDEAEEGLSRLRGKLDDARESGFSLGQVFQKAFDPKQLIAMGASFASLKSAIGLLTDEFNDWQAAVDKRFDASRSVAGKGDELAKELKKAEEDRKQAEDRVKEAENRLAAAQAEDSKSLAQATQQRRDEIASLELDLTRAQEDKRKAVEEQAKRVEEAQGRINVTLRGTPKDGARPIDADKLAEERRKLEELKGAGIPIGLQRRITDLETQLMRKAIDPITGGDASGSARGAVGDARAEFWKAQRKEAEARDADKAFRDSPEGKAAAIVEERIKDLEKLRDKTLANTGGARSLSSKELELIEDIERAAGINSIDRKFSRFAKRLNDGEITMDEAAQQASTDASSIRNKEAMRQAFESGDWTRREVAPTNEQARQAAALEELVRLFRESNRKVDEHSATLNRVISDIIPIGSAE